MCTNIYMYAYKLLTTFATQFECATNIDLVPITF